MAQTQTGYALIAAGVLVGGLRLSKAALDELLDPNKKASRAAERRAVEIPMSKTDKVVQFGVMSLVFGSVAMHLYDWYKTGKPLKVEDIL